MADTKTVSGRTHSRGDFLVVEDPDKVSTWHLPVKVQGKPSRSLAAAAWAALFSNYRGQSYQGPGKEQAKKKLKALYRSEGWTMPTESERIPDNYTPLSEAAVRQDGTIGLKIISPGWGTSGYYSGDVLERDIPSAFPAGTHMYWNHPTATEESERPEGDLSRLAAVTVSNPYFDEAGASGPGMYADAKVFAPYSEAINEMAPHIGVSIRGRGRQEYGEAEGKEGPLVTEISQGVSVDFVTKPGAGGEILQLFESVADAKPLPDMRVKEVEQLPLLEVEDGNVEIKEQETMSDELKEVQDRLAEAQSEIADRDKTIAKLREMLVMKEAKQFVTDALFESGLPDMTRQRLQRELVVNPPLDEGKIDEAAYQALIDEAVQEAQSEIAAITGSDGKIKGQGSAAVDDGLTLEEANKRLEAALNW